MSNLTNTVSNIDINSPGLIGVFSDNVKTTKLIGGVVGYTRKTFQSKYGDDKGNLMNSNLLKNFGGGLSLLEEPSDIYSHVIGPLYQYNDKFVDADGLKLSTIEKLSVGSLYSLKKGKYSNAGKKIITKEGFLNFAASLRNLQIKNRNNSTYFYHDNSNSFLNLIDVYRSLENYNMPSGKYLEIKNFFNNEMLYEYYDSYFHKLDETNVDGGYRGKIRKDLTAKGLLNYITQFGIYEIPEELEVYSVNKPWSGPKSIKTKTFGGTFLSTPGDNKVYHYYEERDNTTETPSLNSADSERSTQTLISTGDGVSNLIKKTNEVFKNIETKTLINRFHTNLRGEDFKNDELVTSYSKFGLSRGRNLLTKQAESTGQGTRINGYDNPYCRVWTAHHQYSKLSRRIRPFYNGEDPESISDTQKNYGSGLRPNGSSHLGENTVLKRDGFVRITPSDETLDIRKCMFSIENLAWRDINMDNAMVSSEQRGPNGGRIMWFPPYNLKFTENVSVDWNANKFIGRGEQIYTYTNTDRTGTLSFTLLVDHPSILNKYRNVENKKSVENDILRYFAGCNKLDEAPGGSKDESENPIEPISEAGAINPSLEKRGKDFAIIAFFPNNWSGSNFKNNIGSGLTKLQDYEMTNNNCIFGDETDETGMPIDDIDTGNTNVVFTYHSKNESKYFLNNFTENTTINYNGTTYKVKDLVKDRIFNNSDEELEFYSIFDPVHGIYALKESIKEDVFSYGVTSGGVKEFKIISVTGLGSASSHGKEDDPNDVKNERLSLQRVNFLLKGIEEECGYIDSRLINNCECLNEVTQVSEVGEQDINDLDAKLARFAYIVFHVEFSANNIPSPEHIEANTNIITDYGDNNSEVPLEGGYSLDENEAVYLEEDEPDSDWLSYDNEFMYFNELRENEMVYKYITDKIKYFDPAFHSITPEGFNARLTFLHQCTRQGPTVDLSSGKVDEDSNAYLKYAGNLAFGRPPYCILRIGDFYFTKICIQSMSISYDGGEGMQWDLNQEGIGVQPMFANIDLNFVFIGGHGLAGPIERLQNAITHNYYANASVYDRKADLVGGSPYDPSLNIPKAPNGTPEDNNNPEDGDNVLEEKKGSFGGGSTGGSGYTGRWPSIAFPKSRFRGFGGGDFGGGGASGSWL